MPLSTSAFSLPRGARRAAVLAGVLALGLGACADDGTGPSSTRVKPELRFLPVAWAVDLTPDGSIAVLQDPFSPLGDLYYHYTATGITELKTQVGSVFRDFATGVSANGYVTALHGDPVVAGFWTPNAEWTDLANAYADPCGGDIAGAWDISADGTVIVGLTWNGCNAEAFAWDARGSGIMTPLELLGAPFPGSSQPPTNRATVVSDDGSTIAGFAQTDLVDRWPAKWLADGSGALLTGGPGADQPGEVLAISADGRVLAGTWGGQGFYWTEAGGTVLIGQLPGADPFFDPVYVNAVARDGALLVGSSGNAFFTQPRAVVWTAAAGLRTLDDVLADADVTVPAGYALTGILAASTDGTRLLGIATDSNFRQVSFVLTLPPSAYGL